MCRLIHEETEIIMRKKNTIIKISILSLALIQMGTNGIAPALSGISEAFPQFSASVVQYLMTFPSLIVVVVSLFAAKLSSKLSKKTISTVGCALTAVGGILGTVFHTSLPLLFVFAGIIGLGIGLVVPMELSLVNDCFEGEERAAMMGACNGGANLGSMVMTMVGGVLAATAWNLNYFVYLLAIPGLILTILFIPDIRSGENVMTDNTAMNTNFVSSEKKSQKVTTATLYACIIGGLFLFLFNIGPTNLSMFVTEQGIGDAAMAGTASTFFLFGGLVMGLFFGKVHQHLKEFMIPVGAVALIIGMLVVAGSSSIVMLCIGCFIAGTSICFTMPKCMLVCTLGCDPTQSTFAVALVMAMGNLGTFATPVLTTIAATVTGSDVVANRFYLAAIIAAIIFVLTMIKALQMTKLFRSQKENCL